MGKEQKANQSAENIHTAEQEAMLDLYIQTLDDFSDALQAAEKMEVEIETQHLKTILTKC